jgi:hypothetical protein
MSQLISALKNLILQTPDLTRCSHFLAGSAFQFTAEKITGRAARQGAFKGATRGLLGLLLFASHMSTRLDCAAPQPVKLSVLVWCCV